MVGELCLQGLVFSTTVPRFFETNLIKGKRRSKKRKTKPIVACTCLLVLGVRNELI